MPILYTWHSPGFDLTRDRLRRDRSPYCDTVDAYLDKIFCLSDYLRTDQYVFCFVRPEQHVCYEVDRTVEWTIEAEDGDIPAYVDNVQWESFLEGGCPLRYTLRTGFTGREDWCAILKLPVPVEKLRRKRTYRRVSLSQAGLVSERVFWQSAGAPCEQH